MTKFEELKCWKQSRILVNRVYTLSAKSKFNKDFGLRNQIRRSSISVMTDIAEGFSRINQKDCVRFLDYAQSATEEVRSLVFVAYDLDYISGDESREVQQLTREIRKLIQGLIKHINVNSGQIPG